MPECLGLTMRVDRTAGSTIYSDALSQEWPPFLRDAVGEMPWLLIPNLGKDVDRFLKQWRIDGVILTGGNDIGQSELRDETEEAVVTYCSNYNLPIVGICRGLQFLQEYYCGKTRPVSAERHVGTVHQLEVCDDFGFQLLRSRSIHTNSFHRHGVHLDDLSPDLKPWLVSEDGLVEGVRHMRKPQIAVQWHPERENPDASLGIRLFQYLRDG